MANRYFMNLVRTLDAYFAKLIIKEEGENEMVSWRTLDPDLLADVPPGKLRRVKAAIKEQVRDELMKERLHDPDEVEEERSLFKQFARDVELDARAHSTVMAEAAAKEMKSAASFFRIKVAMALSIIVFTMTLGVAAAVKFPSILTTPFLFVGMSMSLVFGLVVSMTSLDRSESSHLETFRDHASAGDLYKELAEKARDAWRVDANRAHSTEDVSLLFNELKSQRESAKRRSGMQFRITEVEPVRERLRIQMTADDDDFDARLAQAQKKEEEEEQFVIESEVPQDRLRSK